MKRSILANPAGAVVAVALLVVPLLPDASAHPTGATHLNDQSTSTASGNQSVVGGGFKNRTTGDFATVAGGATNTAGNSSAIISAFATVGGGTNNTASTIHAVVGGGRGNIAEGQYSVIRGGVSNSAYYYEIPDSTVARYATIGGGSFNEVEGGYGTIGGGLSNVIARAPYQAVGGGFRNVSLSRSGTIPGGSSNDLRVPNSFAAGVRAQTRSVGQGAFIWSGSATVDTFSTNANSFTVRAPGGVRFITSASATNFTPVNPILGVVLRPLTTAWTALSDRESKTDFQPIKPREVLAKLAAMPVTSWQYKHDPSRRYIGPTSQDFMEAFRLGDYDKGINTLDADGVTFAAIQGLVEELKDREKALESLNSRLANLQNRLAAMPPAR